MGGCFEMSLVPWYTPSAVAVMFHKYMALRFLLDSADSIAAHRPGGCVFAILHRSCRLWTLSWRFPRDFALGLVLSVANIVLSSIPCLGRLHGVFLFHALPQAEQREATLKKDGD